MILANERWGKIAGELMENFPTSLKGTQEKCVSFLSPDVITWTATIFLDREEISLEGQAAYWGDRGESQETPGLVMTFLNC